VTLSPASLPTGSVQYTLHAIENGLYALGTGAKLVTVEDGGTLGGTGRIRNTDVVVQPGGALAPGASIGTFWVGSADIDGTLVIEIDESDDLVNDLLIVEGNLNIEDAEISFDIAGSLTQTSYLIATYGGALLGEFDPDDAPMDYTFDYSVIGQVSLVSVPEPASVLMIGLGIVGLAAIRRRTMKI
jgi:hypothetical protein